MSVAREVGTVLGAPMMRLDPRKDVVPPTTRFGNHVSSLIHLGVGFQGMFDSNCSSWLPCCACFLTSDPNSQLAEGTSRTLDDAKYQVSKGVDIVCC